MGVMRLYVFELPVDGTLPAQLGAIKEFLAEVPRVNAPPIALPQSPPVAQSSPPAPTSESKTETAPEPAQEVATPAPNHPVPPGPPPGERGVDYAQKAVALLPREFSAKLIYAKMKSLGWTTQAKEPIRAVQSVLYRDKRFVYNVKRQRWTFRETAAGAEKER